jgi:hypothetical protein
MGQRGPVPNRSEDLSRERDSKRNDRPEITKGELRPVEIPEADPYWHPIAHMLWEGLQVSGQADWYQQSDWAFAYSLMDDLTFYKNPFTTKDGTEYHKRSGQMLQTIYSAMERLLVTEGDRRRARIELSAPDTSDEEAAVLTLADYTTALANAGSQEDDE